MANADLSNILFIGKRKVLNLPDSTKVEIRENNGEDEGILSKLADALAGTSISNYLSSIITNDFTVPDSEHKLTPADITAWKVNKKTYTLLAARAFSLGNKFLFSHTCGNPQCQHTDTFEEDLTPHLEPYSDSNKLGVSLYPLGQKDTEEFTLSSGKVCRIDILTGIGENVALAIDRNNYNRNHGLLIRNLQLKHGTEWEKVFQFGMFSSPEMVQLRNKVAELDPIWDPATHITCPKCNNVSVVPLLEEPAFFYPTEI